MRLASLEIEDFGLIARASLAFADGFTVCSGETGSGKTMLLGALAFALGERSSADVVRRGAARARVTLAIEPDDAARARFASDGFELDAGEAALFVREMTPGGKSSARINGRLATSGQLRAYGDALLEAVGQHEQQRLLAAAYQRDVLDTFAGHAAIEARDAVAVGFDRARALDAELAASDADTGRAAAELAFARFARDEIDAAAPVAGEDDALRERREYLANVGRIGAAVATAYDALVGRERAVSDGLGAACAALAPVVRFAPALARVADALAGLQSDAADLALALSREADGADFDPAELESTVARLDLLESLKKKYGGSLAATLDARARFDDALEHESTRDGRDAASRADLARVRATLARDAGLLSAARAVAARALETRVARELAALAMPAARFAVDLEPAGEVTRAGAEHVTFGLAPNPGEAVRSLARAASGGELSRVLLALVVALADRRERTALVFDEIDAGIGGATANAVGSRLGALATGGQVLCVTHLAQIAAWADRHYVLRKRIAGEGTVIDLVALDDRGEVLAEVARMLSGSSAKVALQHAQALVRDVRDSRARATA